jgi:hypothetical protein
MRQRRGDLLRALSTDGEVEIARDPEAAHSLVVDALAQLSDDELKLLPTTG